MGRVPSACSVGGHFSCKNLVLDVNARFKLGPMATHTYFQPFPYTSDVNSYPDGPAARPGASLIQFFRKSPPPLLWSAMCSAYILPCVLRTFTFLKMSSTLYVDQRGRHPMPGCCQVHDGLPLCREIKQAEFSIWVRIGLAAFNEMSQLSTKQSTTLLCFSYHSSYAR